MKKVLTVLAVICIVGLLMGATYIRGEKSLTLSSDSITLLDGTTENYTYQPGDRTSAYCVSLSERCDAVVIKAYGAGSANNTATFKIWGYSKDGPAELVYTGTATLGAGVAGSGLLYVDTFSAPSTNHVTTVGISDSAGDRVCKMALDTVGYTDLMFEIDTFTTMTNITFEVREYGFK